MKRHQFQFASICAITTILISQTGCSSRSSQIEFSPVDKPAGLDSAPIPGIEVFPATPTQCAAGGTVYQIFVDENRNGLHEASEVVSNTQVVCNGANGSDGSNGSNGQNGSDGFSTLFTLNRISTGFSACASGAGVQINSGVDVDRSNALENSEINSAQILCDGERGADGSTGASGPAGSNGHSVVFEVVAAPISQCASGGSTVLMALDIEDGGVYSSSLPNQQAMTLCNGASAPVAAYTPVEPIQPCGQTVAFKEVLLRLYNGQILGSFSNDTGGTMTRLAFLPDGTYINTDDSGCQFTLATSGSQRSISWWNQVQMVWNML